MFNSDDPFALQPNSLAADARLFMIVQRIKKVSEHRKLTVEQVSEGVCNPDYLEKVENGNVRPTMLVLEQLVSKLGFTIHSILDWEPSHDDVQGQNQGEASFVAAWSEPDGIPLGLNNSSSSQSFTLLTPSWKESKPIAATGQGKSINFLDQYIALLESEPTDPAFIDPIGSEAKKEENGN